MHESCREQTGTYLIKKIYTNVQVQHFFKYVIFIFNTFLQILTPLLLLHAYSYRCAVQQGFQTQIVLRAGFQRKSFLQIERFGVPIKLKNLDHTPHFVKMERIIFIFNALLLNLLFY